jgi:hypothetical protein
MCFKYICLVFLQATLTSFHGSALFNLGFVLVCDDSPECKEMALRCVQTMLERLDKNARNQLFDAIVDILKSKEVEYYILFYRILSMI